MDNTVSTEPKNDYSIFDHKIYPQVFFVIGFFFPIFFMIGSLWSWWGNNDAVLKWGAVNCIMTIVSFVCAMIALILTR